MSKVSIDLSGASGGSRTSVLIYQTPEYDGRWRGACLAHGSSTMGPASPDSQRVEIVMLELPGLEICVRAEDVRGDLRALLRELRAGDGHASQGMPPEILRAQAVAFDALRGVILAVAVRREDGRGLTVEHLEKIIANAYADGVAQGERLMRRRFREMLEE